MVELYNLRSFFGLSFETLRLEILESDTLSHGNLSRFVSHYLSHHIGPTLTRALVDFPRTS